MPKNLTGKILYGKLAPKNKIEGKKHVKNLTAETPTNRKIAKLLK